MTERKEFYTHGHHPVVVGSHAQRTVADSAQFLLPFLGDGMRVLDFGCGPGSITVGLIDHVGPTGSVVGVDSSAEALAIATQDAAADRVEYQEASIYELPFPAAEFDVAYGHQVLQHLSNPVGALREVRRVLKPGGRVAIRDADFGSMTHYPRYEDLERWLDIYHQVARSNGGEPDAGRRLASWARKAGFTSIIATTSSWHYATGAERQAWAQLWSDRIQLPRFADRAEQLGLATDIGRIASSWLSWANEPDGWFAFVHGEVIATRDTAEYQLDQHDQVIAVDDLTAPIRRMPTGGIGESGRRYLSQTLADE